MTHKDRRNSKEEIRRYKIKYPWAAYYYTSKSRSPRFGREHTMCVADFKDLWERDKAHLFKRPSIDRIDNAKGYTKENCRFIELRENQAQGGRQKGINYKLKKQNGRNQ